tara:strand:- start:2457 stop:2954 length:498 start_codon:yes stop_codon:yes gene_type:complete
MDEKTYDLRRKNLAPQYKPGSSRRKVATQFGLKNPLNEQVNMANPNKGFWRNKRDVTKDMTVEQRLQQVDEMSQGFAERGAAFHAGMLGGMQTEWKGKKSKPKSTLKDRGIPNVKQKKTMGSTIKKVFKSPRLLTPAGLIAYIMRPKSLGAGTLTKTTGEYKKIK